MSDLAPVVVRSDDVARWRWDHYGLVVGVERVHERSHDLWAELTVADLAQPDIPTIRRRLNLQAQRTVASLARELDERIPGTPWPELLETVIAGTIDHHRSGARPVLIDDGDDNPPDAPGYLLRPLVAAGGVSILFAPGGSGKSMIALAAGISVATGSDLLDTRPRETASVLYLDWESEEADHRWRMRAIARGHSIPRPIPGVYYRREHASLASVADGIRRYIVDLNVGMVVVDSLGGARGGAPESAEETLRLFAVMRSWGVPVLAVDHESKAQIQSSLNGRQAMPFGSVYSWNSARLVWRLVPSADTHSAAASVMLQASKANNDRLPKRRGLSISVNNDEQTIRFASTDPLLLPEFVDRTPSWERIKLAILDAHGHPQTVADLAETTGLSDDTVRSALRRYPDRFTQVGKGRWGVVTAGLPLPDPW